MGGNLNAPCLRLHGPVGVLAIAFPTDTQDVEMRPFHFSLPSPQRATPRAEPVTSFRKIPWPLRELEKKLLKLRL